MDVYDSNIWIHGLVGDCDDAIALLDDVVNKPIHVAVSAYIFEEVMQNLSRADLSSDVIEAAQTEFATMVYENHTIHGPTQAEIKQMDIGVRRRDPRTQTMAEALGIQPKDVPILVFAHQLTQRPSSPVTTIHTADHEFGQYDPQQHFRDLLIRYVDCSG